MDVYEKRIGVESERPASAPGSGGAAGGPANASAGGSIGGNAAPAREPEEQGIGYGVLALIVFGTTLGGLLQNAVNTVLPAIMGETGVTVGMAQWLVTIMQLCLGIVVPLVAFLVRRYTIRALFVFSMAVFTVGTFLVAGGQSFEVIFAGRVLEGVGAGIAFPLVQVVVFHNFPRARWGTIMGVVGLAFGFAPNIGPTIAGVCTDIWDWRSLFWGTAVIALLVTVLMVLTLPRDYAGGQARRLDWASVALSTLGFGGVLMGLTNAADAGFATPVFLVPFAVGAVGLVLFVWRQQRIPNPLLDLNTFRNRDFTVGTIMVCLLYAAFIGVTLVLPVGLQQLHGYDALHAGIALLPGTVAALVMNPLSGVLLDRKGPRFIIWLGAVLLLVGTLPMIALSMFDDLWLIMLLQGVRTFGISALIQPISTWSVRSLVPDLVPDGTAISNTVRQVAAAMGTSLMVLIMAIGGVAGNVSAFGVDAAMGLSAVFAGILLVLAFAYVKK